MGGELIGILLAILVRKPCLSAQLSSCIILIDSDMARSKIADQRRQEQLRGYQTEYARLKARLRQVGFICEGSLVERWMRCGKPNCASPPTNPNNTSHYFQLSFQ